MPISQFCPKCSRLLGDILELSLPETHPQYWLLGSYPFIGYYCYGCTYALLIIPSWALKLVIIK